jgi:hypothetical protein
MEQQQSSSLQTQPGGQRPTTEPAVQITKQHCKMQEKQNRGAKKHYTPSHTPARKKNSKNKLT